jgi:uncharacterized membrane protein
MERTSVSEVAGAHERQRAAGGLQGLWRELESLSPLSAERLCLLLTIAAAVLGGVWFSSLSVARHRDFQSFAYDLGFFDQIIWSTSQGRLFETSFVAYNFLGQHFEPVLLLFAVPYRFGAGVESLIIVQGCAVAAAAIPLQRATTAVTGEPVAGLLAALAFLANPALHDALLFGFHPELLSLPLLFLALLLLVEEKPVASAITAASLLLIKEDLAIVVVAFGVLIAVRGFRREGLRLSALGVAWFVVIGLVAMTAIRGGHSSDLTVRYEYLVAGSDALSLIPNALARGLENLSDFTVPGTLKVLASQGFVPLASPASLLALPSIVANGLSGHSQQAKLELHYSTATLVLLWVSTVLALGWLRRFHRLGNVALALAVIALLTGAVISVLTDSPARGITWEARVSPSHRDALREAIALIPPDASVDAQSTILPHVSSRREVYEFPDRRVSDFVIVDDTLPVLSGPAGRGYFEERKQLPANGYERIYKRDGVELWQLTKP